MELDYRLVAYFQRDTYTGCGLEHFLFSIIYGMSSFPLTNSYFSEGLNWPSFFSEATSTGMVQNLKALGHLVRCFSCRLLVESCLMTGKFLQIRNDWSWQYRVSWFSILYWVALFERIQPFPLVWVFSGISSNSETYGDHKMLIVHEDVIVESCGTLSIHPL